MDDKRCVRSTFAYMPSGIALNSYTENEHTSKKGKQRFSQEKKCRGDIVYVQNPLFKNAASRSKDNFSTNHKLIPINYEQNNNNNDYYFHRFFSPISSLQKSQKTPQNNTKKSRKDGMKARAETRRRDALSNDSSDDEYSSINSLNDLRSPNNSHRNSANMEEAYNRRSRAARTERYFRRLSREDNSHDYDSGVGNCRITAPKRVQEARLSIGKCETLPFANSGRDNLREQSRNLSFSHHDDAFLSNPIYRTSRADSPVFYNKPCPREKTENQTYAANIDYSRTRRSDPGAGAILAYKNKSPRTLDRVQYIEPQILNFQAPQQIFEQKKPSGDPRRVVRRSYSFQSEIPRDYEAVIMRKAQTAQASKSGNDVFKGLNSLLSSPLADFQNRKFNSPIERGEFKAREKNLTPTNDSGSLNLLSNLTEDKIPSKKRSSKDLGKELSELEKMYTSLRLSDDNLLERAEERCAEELSLKGQAKSLNNESSKYLSSGSSTDSIPGEFLTGEKQQSSEAHVINDDMAYRKMQPKKMPALSETQNSLSQISYLLASSALILGETEFTGVEHKAAKEEPNITKDDMVYRNLHYANNVLKVVEPQPPFGIPLRPATPSTNSNYLCSSPVALKSPPLKYVPQSEPNLITDDLAFRNLRKDAPKSPTTVAFEEIGKAVDDLSAKNEFENSVLNEDKFFRKKKKAVRSLSANLYGLINEVNNLQLNFE